MSLQRRKQPNQYFQKQEIKIFFLLKAQNYYWVWKDTDTHAHADSHRVQDYFFPPILSNNNNSGQNEWSHNIISYRITAPWLPRFHTLTVLSYLIIFPFFHPPPFFLFSHSFLSSVLGSVCDSGPPPPPIPLHPGWCMACGNNVSAGLLFCLLYIWQAWVSVRLGSYLIRPNAGLKQS